MGRLRSIVEEEIGKMEEAKCRANRRKGIIGIGVKKKWMVVLSTGDSQIEDVDKQSIMRRTGLPARDLRVLDPMPSHPSSILGREKAIVVNLEHVKAIITANQLLMINSENPLFLRFLQDLLSRLLLPPSSNSNSNSNSSSNNHDTTPLSRISHDVVVDADHDFEAKPLLDEEEEGSSNSLHIRIDHFPANNEGIFEDVHWGGNPNSKSTEPAVAAVTSSPKQQLPFEFRALEACIESACTCLESETRRLEEEAYPALDELTSQISTLNLERVRHIKNRLVALSGRVHKVADQLEHLLDDDNDMAEMYLTQKLDARFMDQTSLKEGNNSVLEDIDESDESYSVKDKSTGPKLDVEELEMLLEAYFAQINGILQKLSSLSEYVDDTEDYINIMLDDKQNQLLQVAVIFNTLNTIVNAGIVVVGLFGMNIHIDLFDGQPYQFWATTCGTLVGCGLLLLVSVWWGKKRYLLSHL